VIGVGESKVVGSQVNEIIERRWAVRDAVLKWVYIDSASSSRGADTKVESVSSGVGWSAEPLTQDEVDDAVKYLFGRGLIEGIETFGGIVNPTTTASGELFADAGTSVRSSLETPVKADPAGITIHASGNANVAVGNNNHQSIEVSNIKRAVEVADALDRAAAEPGVPAQDAIEAHEIAEAIRSEAAQSEPNNSAFKKLLLRAVGAGITTFGSAAATEAGQLAIGAVPLFM